MQTLVDSLTKGKRGWEKVGLAFGGTHYSEKFNKILLESDYSLSAVVAKHSLEWINSEMLGQMIQRTTRFPKYVVVDWKGMGQHRDKILAIAQQFALEVVKV